MNYDFYDKKARLNQFIQDMLNKTLTMFEWEGLPESIPFKELEKILQVNGYAIITENEQGELTAYNGSFSGEDVYFNPTHTIITNAPTGFNKTLEIDSECIVIKNDDMQTGLYPLFTKYGMLLIENEITILTNNYNMRIQRIISATDDNTVESAKQYLEDIKNGDIGVIGSSKMFDSLKIDNKTNENNIISSLIELEQYLKASLFNEMGLNANFNMKRERLNSSEVELNEDMLYPFVDNMLDNRKAYAEKINDLYGTEITVEFSSIWKLKEKEVEKQLEEVEPTLEEPESVSEEPEKDVLTEMIKAIYYQVFGSEYGLKEEIENEENEENEEEKGSEENEIK